MADLRTLVKVNIDLGATSDVLVDMSAITAPYQIIAVAETNIVNPGQFTKVEFWTGPNRTGTKVTMTGQVAAGGRFDWTSPITAALLLTNATLYAHVLSPNSGGSVDCHLVGIDFP